MSPQKRRVLKILALIYVILVIAFLAHNVMVTKGEGRLRTLDKNLVGTETELTEPLDLRSLEGKTATPEVADALLTAGVTVIGTAQDPESPVGSSLVGKTFKDARLPAGAKLTEALWEEVLVEEAKTLPTVYVKGAGNIMGFDLTLVFIVMNFLGLLVILYLLLWDPILKVLDDRAATIQTDLDTAASNRKQAATLKGKYEQFMLGSKQERQELIAEGRKEGESERQRIVGAAREEAEKIVERTRGELEAAAEKVRRDLRAEVGGISVELAEKILRREISEQDHEELVNDFLSRLSDVEQ